MLLSSTLSSLVLSDDRTLLETPVSETEDGDDGDYCQSGKESVFPLKNGDQGLQLHQTKVSDWLLGSCPISNSSTRFWP